jgi:lyso-ornithine lipid O-acyltransferase
MLGWLRLVVTVVLAGLAFLILVPFHLLAIAIGGRAAGQVPVLWHRFVLFLTGTNVTVTGRPASERPLLLLANHMSWLDIPVLGSVMPLSFVAKKEVADWPVFGLFAKLQRSVFINRERRHATGAVADVVAQRLSKGDVIVVFAEGTSSDGNRVLPFRSALVGAAQKALTNAGSATIQPVAIAYTRMLGLPIGRQHRAEIAWYGGTDLIPHLANVLAKGGIDVHVVFGPARRLSADGDRKKVTAEAEALVRRLVANLNTGRDPQALLAKAVTEPPAKTPVEANRA